MTKFCALLIKRNEKEVYKLYRFFIRKYFHCAIFVKFCVLNLCKKYTILIFQYSKLFHRKSVLTNGHYAFSKDTRSDDALSGHPTPHHSQSQVSTSLHLTKICQYFSFLSLLHSIDHHFMAPLRCHCDSYFGKIHQVTQ